MALAEKARDRMGYSTTGSTTPTDVGNEYLRSIGHDGIIKQWPIIYF